MDAPLYDAVVVGAGFGGLGAALTLAAGGARTAVFEALRYPGGCASTFIKHGYHFEAGATLFAGFDDHQLFGRWMQQFSLPVRFVRLADPIELRRPGLRLRLPSTPGALVERFTALPGAPVEALRRFFELQSRVADALWPLFDDPGRLPPFDWAAWGWHLRRLWAYRSLPGLIGRSLLSVAKAYGVADFLPFRDFMDGMCQISLQLPAAEAEAPFGLAVLDYCSRGAGHVHGGIGVLAEAMLGAVEQQGGTVHLAQRVQGLQRAGDLWVVEARGRTVRARAVLLNLLPQAAAALLPAAAPTLAPWSAAVEQGWGAAMWYAALPPDPALPDAPFHLELIGDRERPFHSGNHVFVSVSGADEPRGIPGHRTLTASTHVPMAALRALEPTQQGPWIAAIQAQMRAVIAAQAPEIGAPLLDMTASPRTFARFTRRPYGYVGGVPRRVGWKQYLQIGTLQIQPGLFLVGDTTFPGQSTLATAVGGARTASQVLSALNLPVRTLIERENHVRPQPTFGE